MSLDSPTGDIRNRRRIAMAAAAVVAVVGVAAIATNSPNSDDDVAPLSTAAPTVVPTTVAPTTTAYPKTKTVRFDVANTDLPVVFTVPEDWIVAEGWSAYNDSVGVLFDDIVNIYADGCQWVPLDPPVGSTVDDLVAAWANLPDLAPTAAIDHGWSGPWRSRPTQGGRYTGKQIEFTVPDYTASECKEGKYGLWDVPGTGNGETPGYWAQLPNQHLQMWVLDIDGTRLVIGASTFPNTSPEDRAALDEVLRSIGIEPPAVP